jgi:hypothetical protein
MELVLRLVTNALAPHGVFLNLDSFRSRVEAAGPSTKPTLRLALHASDVSEFLLRVFRKGRRTVVLGVRFRSDRENVGIRVLKVISTQLVRLDNSESR